MAQMKTEGLEEFVAELNKLAAATPGVTKKCLYDGARVLADGIREAVKGLPLDPDGHFTPVKDPLRTITAKDREDLAEAVGISKIESGASSSVSVSFAGYISRTEEKFPKGVPAALIARSIEKGTSVRAKKPFLRPAIKKNKDAVLDAMQATMAESLAQISQKE